MRQMQIASYIILLDDMKSIMKAMLRTFANDDSENIEFDKQELKLWKEKAIENKSFIEKEITASKEMIKKLEEFLSFCKKYEEIRI